MFVTLGNFHPSLLFESKDRIIFTWLSSCLAHTYQTSVELLHWGKHSGLFLKISFESLVLYDLAESECLRCIYMVKCHHKTLATPTDHGMLTEGEGSIILPFQITFCQRWQWYLLLHHLCKHHLNNQVNVTCVFTLWSCRKLSQCKWIFKSN